MRKQFPGYYTLSQEEFDAMWQDGIFSVDTNVLLNLYRYTKPTRDRLLEILGKLKDRLWLTNQAGLEFHRNRQAVIAEQLNAYDILAADLGTSIAAAMGKVKQQYARNFNIDIPALEATFSEASDKVARLLKEAKAKHPDFVDSDPILDQVTTLFEGRVGNPYTPADLVLKHQEAQTRYDRQQPPGYKDAKKPIPDRYGDVR
jgi:PIN like domain